MTTTTTALMTLRRGLPAVLLSLLLPGLTAGAGERGVEERRLGGVGEENTFHLPFPPGVKYRVLFGPGDPPHHLSPRNRHAYDFAMPLGSEVSAAADGEVIRAVSRNAGRTGRSQDNNLVAIRHRDGRVSEYHHLMQDGVLVRVGERVERGEVIGFSGQSGRAEGPHLHFVVVRDGKSLPVRFKELSRKPGRGDVCKSRNVPSSSARRFLTLERGLRLSRLLAEEKRTLQARILLQELRGRRSDAKTPSARRKALALGPLERALGKAVSEMKNEDLSPETPRKEASK